MVYYINKTITANFDRAVELVTEALKTEGFGVLSEIDIQQKLKENLVEIAAVNPVASMMAVDNKQLAGIAGEIKTKLEKVIASL